MKKLLPRPDDVPTSTKSTIDWWPTGVEVNAPTTLSALLSVVEATVILRFVFWIFCGRMIESVDALRSTLMLNGNNRRILPSTMRASETKQNKHQKSLNTDENGMNSIDRN